jgi:hypothetical protein
MADGADWWLPRPRLGFTVRPRAGGGGTALEVVAADERLAPLYDRMLRVADSIGLFKARMDIIRVLLLANYDLSDEEVAGLVRWFPGDRLSEEIMGGWSDHIFPVGRADREADPDGPGGDGRPKA